MRMQALILGSGQSGQAIAAAWQILALKPEWKDLARPVFLPRGAKLKRANFDAECEPLLILSHPQGLHAQSLLEAIEGGFDAICVEKPAAVRREELKKLQGLSQPIAVFHNYRQLWGVQTLRKLVANGDLGEVFAIEGRYWQASAAARALQGQKPSASWKNNQNFLGPHDVFLDLGCHWVDICYHMLQDDFAASRATLSYVNAEASHRDTHVHLDAVTTRNCLVRASLSKTLHGFGNELEVVVCGSRASVSWRFQDPDYIVMGEGQNQRRIYRKKDETLTSGFPPGHGLGWLEGYVATLDGYLRWRKSGNRPEALASLQEHLAALRGLFNAELQVLNPFTL